MNYAIVCVDDEPVIVDLLSFQLKKIFNTESTFVETFTNPQDVEAGVDKIVEYGISVIFMVVDYQMPHINGAQLIRTIKAKHPSIKFFMLSGQANNTIVHQLLEEGLLEKFIAKPWSEQDLEKALDKFIDQF
jgi:YesN/AraC family two-component response regulator